MYNGKEEEEEEAGRPDTIRRNSGVFKVKIKILVKL